jgi:uncharacterized protein YecT (DUF1311 family)
MSPKLLSLAAATVSMIAAAGFAAAQAGGAGPAAHTVKLAPVKIHETFTPLPCAGSPSHRTTLEQEGCAEKQILKTDSQVNVLGAEIFQLLGDDRARRDFNAAQRAWLNYRKADCFSMSDLFEGGTEAGVVDAQCVASRNDQRIKDLRGFKTSLLRTG